VVGVLLTSNYGYSSLMLQEQHDRHIFRDICASCYVLFYSGFFCILSQ